MNENVRFLPVGTVVRLKGGVKNIMISGFCPVSNDDKKMYDYCACLYPEGVVSSEINFLFNHDQIEQVLFKGFVNDEETNFKTKLNDFVLQTEAGNQINGSDVSPQLSQDPLSMQTVNQPQMFTNDGGNQQ